MPPKTRSPIGKVAPGTPVANALSVGVWNGFVDASEAHKRNRRGNAVDQLPNLDSPDLIRFRNDTGFDLATRDVVGFAGVLFDHDDNATEFRDRPTLLAATPNTTTHRAGRWGIVRRATPDGKIGVAQIAGVVSCRVHLVTTDDRFAGIQTGERSKLVGGPGSARILYAPDELGEQQCVVAIGSRATGILARTVDTIPAAIDTGDERSATTGTVAIYHRDDFTLSPDQLDDADRELSAWSFASVAIPADSFVWCEYDARGVLWIISADCLN